MLASIAGPAIARAEEPPAAPIEVTARATPARRDPGRTLVTAEQAARVAGGASDPMKVVESAPGVGRTAFDSGGIVLRGAAGARVYVDGVEIPALFHGGGLRGVIAGDLLQDVEVIPGAFGAEHGRTLGGVVRLRTRELPEQGVHAVITADLLDAGAFVTASTGRLRVALGGRAGYLDRIVARVAPKVADLVPIPRYGDYQGKVSIALRPAESLDLLLLGSSDAIERALASTDPASARRERASSSFHRAILRYARLAEDGAAFELTPSLGLDRSSLVASFGGSPAQRADISWRYGLRASARVPLARWITATFGFDGLATRASLARAGSLTIPAREGDLRVFGQPPGADVATDRWSSNILVAAPYFAADLALGPLTLTPGLRVELSLIEGSRATPRAGDTPAIGFSRLAPAVDPRLAARLALSDRVTLSAAAGLHHQPPDPADLSAVSGTPALTFQRAIHASAGPSARLLDGLSLDATAYYEALDHLVVRSRSPSPKRAQALTQDGEGRTFGVEIALRQKLRGGFFGWVAYTVGRSERRYAGDGGYRLFDEDRTHTLAVVASYERAGWTVGARLRAATGAPRTPVIGSFYEATGGAYQPILGAQNSDRLPAFYQLDLRVARRFTWPSLSLSLSLDVLDVTFHRNAEEIGYSHDWSEKAFITGLPLLAVLGARIEI